MEERSVQPAASPLKTALAQFDAAADRLHLDDGMRAILYGGAKGGVVVDPKALSPTEMENLTRRYTTEISVLIGPNADIPAPDMGADGRVIAWIMDTISMHRGYTEAGVVTGKPISVGGTLGRQEATGRGILYAV